MKLNHMFETPNYFKLFKYLGHRSGLGLGLGIFMSRLGILKAWLVKLWEFFFAELKIIIS